MIINEHIVRLLRKTTLTLEDIGKLSPSQFSSLLNEFYLQEGQDNWNNQHSVASIIAAIYNTIPRNNHHVYVASDFLSSNKPIKDMQTNVNSLAKEKGIRLPSK
jgi:hypothetical protein